MHPPRRGACSTRLVSTQRGGVRVKRAHVVDPARTFFRRVVEDDDVVRHHIVARRFVKGRVDVPVAGHAIDAHARWLE